MNTILDKPFVPYQFDFVVLSNLRLFFSCCNEFLNLVYYNSKNFRYLFFIFLNSWFSWNFSSLVNVNAFFLSLSQTYLFKKRIIFFYFLS